MLARSTDAERFTQLGRQPCTYASRPHTAAVTGHAAICTILRNTADRVAMLRVAVEAVSVLGSMPTLSPNAYRLTQHAHAVPRCPRVA